MDTKRKPALILLALALIPLALAMAGLAAGLKKPVDPKVREAFAATAFSVEYGGAGGTLRRWAVPIRYGVRGVPGAEDLATLEGFAAELMEKVPGLPGIREAEQGAEPNLLIHFAPLDELPALDSAYVPGNWGFFSFHYNARQELVKGLVLIASDVTSQRERNHLLKEEITGILGLTNDHRSQEDSILYQPWTTTQDLSALDWELLSLLYSEKLSPGMDFARAGKALGWE